MLRAVIDANAMVSGWTLDILMSLAEEGLYRPVWSQKILEEFCRADEALGFGEGAERKATQMDRAFPDACIEGWERHVGQVVLPDPDDRHVVAATIEGDATASCIVSPRSLNVESEPFGGRLPLSYTSHVH